MAPTEVLAEQHHAGIRRLLEGITVGDASNLFGDRSLYYLLSALDPDFEQHFKVLADFRAYSECHTRVDAAYRDQRQWAKMAILNTARMGKFSSDRTIHEYAKDIWDLAPVPVT